MRQRLDRDPGQGHVRRRERRVRNSTAIKATLDGGAGDDTLQGGSAADTLTGAVGMDTLLGMGGNDLLEARDLLSDALINCGIGTDKADLDLTPKDPNSAMTAARRRLGARPRKRLVDPSQSGDLRVP